MCTVHWVEGLLSRVVFVFLARFLTVPMAWDTCLRCTFRLLHVTERKDQCSGNAVTGFSLQERECPWLLNLDFVIHTLGLFSSVAAVF